MFGRNTSVRPIQLKMVSDGQSNTFMIGENVINQDYHSAAVFFFRRGLRYVRHPDQHISVRARRSDDQKPAELDVRAGF